MTATAGAEAGEVKTSLGSSETRVIGLTEYNVSLADPCFT